MNLNFPFTKPKKIHKIVPTKVREFIHPQREWVIGLSVAVVTLLAGAGVVGTDLYEQFTEEQEFTDIGESSLTYDRAGVVEYEGEFRAREATFQALRAERAVVAPAPVIVVPKELESTEVLDDDVPVIPTGEGIILQ